MAFELGDAVAVLTGAASGIGAQLALQLAARGANLALVDRDSAGLDIIAAQARNFGPRISTHVVDLADADAILRLPAEVAAVHGRVTLLIANAGVALLGTFEAASLEDFSWVHDINFWGPVRLTHAFLPLLRAAPAAQIVLTSSVFGLIAPPGQTAYAASKFALRGFGEALRHEFSGQSIGVTLVHPGGIATNIARSARIGAGVSEAAARDATALFQKLLRTSPDAAARKIIAGIVNRAPRILIGRDAYQIDFLQRLFPARYWGFIARGGRRLEAVTKAKG